MIYYFVYETTNLVNGKKYRGIHKTEKLEDNYLGSGFALKNAIKKYGKQNFKRDILEFCLSYDELIEKEKIYVDEDWVKDNSNYNIKTGGQSAGILSDVSKNKISETLKRKYKSGEIKSVGNLGGTITNDHKDKISETLKRKYEIGELKPNRLGKDSWNKNTKGLQLAWNKGLKFGPQSEDLRKRKSDTLKKRYENEEHHAKGKEPWNKGRKGVQEAWNKGKEMEKIECPYCNKMMDKLNAKKWHFDNCKFKK